MRIEDYQEHSIVFLRISLGLLFLIAGLTKLWDPSGIIGMHTDMGFPNPFNIFFGLLVMISEIVFGLTFLIGFNVRLSSIPLIIIIFFAALGVHLPNIKDGAMVIVILLMHLVILAALSYIAISGPGKYTLDIEGWL